MNVNLKEHKKAYACDAMRCKTRDGLVVIDDAQVGRIKLCPRHVSVYNGEPPAATPSDPRFVAPGDNVAPAPAPAPAPAKVYATAADAPAPTAASDWFVSGSQSSVLAIVEPMRAEAADYLGKLKGIVIKSQAGLDAAGALLQDVKGKIKALEEQRTAVTKPLLDAKRGVDAWFKPAKTALEQLETLLKGTISGYVTAQEQARLAALQSGEHEAALAMEAPTLPAGIQTRTIWRWNVVDVERIPRAYLVVDAAKIQEHVNTFKAQSTIPGIEVYPDTGVRSGSTHGE